MTDTPTVELETYRDDIRKDSPPWLQRGTAERFLYAIGLHVDIFGDAVIAAVKHRFPGLYSNESLGVIGRERRIPRGLYESHATYAGRLRRWLTDHKRRGGPYALLSQLVAHYSPAAFPIDLVYASGRQYAVTQASLDAVAAGAELDDVIERYDSGWSPDSNPEQWARWWLIYHTDQWSGAPPTAAELEDLGIIPRAWNAAHCLGTVIVLPSDGELWNWPVDRVWNESGEWNTPGTVYQVGVGV
jgi:hypothetical protein